MKFLDYEFNENNTLKCFIAICIICIIFIGCLYIEVLIPKRFNKDVKLIESDNYVVEVDLVEKSAVKLVISGLAYNGPVPIERYHQFYVLKNVDNGKSYILKTKMEQRGNLAGTGAEFSGMHSQAITVLIPKGKYDLLVYYDTNSENIMLKTDKQVEI